MALPVTCPGCSSRLNAPDSAAGKRTKCPKCKTIVLVPAESPEPLPLPEEEQDFPGARPASKRARSRPVTDDDREQAPRRKSQYKRAKEESNGQVALITGASALVLAAILGGGLWAAGAFSKKKEVAFEDSRSEPKKVEEPRKVEQTRKVEEPEKTDPMPQPQDQPPTPMDNTTPTDPAPMPEATPTPPASAGGIPAGWVEYESKDLGFKTYFPSQPVAFRDPAQGELKGANLDIVATPNTERNFPSHIKVLRLADVKGKPDQVFEKYIHEKVKDAKNSTEKSRKSAALAGKPATEVHLSTALGNGGTNETVIRFMKTDTLLFEASIRSRNQRPPDDVLNAFFGSFQLAGDAAVVVSSGPRPPLPHGWVDFSPRDGRFRIHMPGNPVMFGGIYSTARVEKPVVGIVSYSDRATIEDLIKQMQNITKQVGETKEVKLAGRTATEVVFQTPAELAITPKTPPKGKSPAANANAANPPLAVMRLVKTDTVTYAVTFANRHAGMPPEKEMKAFFDSFEILKK